MNPATAAVKLRMLNDIQQVLHCFTLRLYLAGSEISESHDLQMENTKEIFLIYAQANNLYKPEQMEDLTQRAYGSMNRSEFNFATFFGTLMGRQDLGAVPAMRVETDPQLIDAKDMPQLIRSDRALYFAARCNLIKLARDAQSDEINDEYQRLFPSEEEKKNVQNVVMAAEQDLNRLLNDEQLCAFVQNYKNLRQKYGMEFVLEQTDIVEVK